MEKTFKIVVLPSKKSSNDGDIVMSPDGKLLAILSVLTKDSMQEFTNQHLYIISDENIDNGGWCLDFDGHTIYQSNHETTDSASNKIIASTDKSITPSSWIPETFVLDYVKAYNARKPINEVILDVDAYGYTSNDKIIHHWAIKTDADGSIIFKLKQPDTFKILLVEEKEIEMKELAKSLANNTKTKIYSREEVIKLCSVIVNMGGLNNPHNWDKWIEENLK